MCENMLIFYGQENKYVWTSRNQAFLTIFGGRCEKKEMHFGNDVGCIY